MWHSMCLYVALMVFIYGIHRVNMCNNTMWVKYNHDECHI